MKIIAKHYLFRELEKLIITFFSGKKMNLLQPLYTGWCILSRTSAIPHMVRQGDAPLISNNITYGYIDGKLKGFFWTLFYFPGVSSEALQACTEKHLHHKFLSRRRLDSQMLFSVLFGINQKTVLAFFVTEIGV